METIEKKYAIKQIVNPFRVVLHKDENETCPNMLTARLNLLYIDNDISA